MSTKTRKPASPSRASRNGKAHVPAEREGDVLTLQQAAKYLKVTAPALAKDAEAGRIPSQLVGGEWRFLRQAIVGWLGEKSKTRIYPKPGIWKDLDEDPEEFIRRARSL